MGQRDDEAENNDRLLSRYVNWIDALGDVYYAKYYVNIIEGSYISINGSGRSYSAVPAEGNYIDAIDFYARNNVYEDDINEFYTKTYPEYVKSKLSGGRKSYHFEYRRIDNEKGYRWVRSSFILADTLENGEVHHIVYTAQYIDEEKEEEEIVESALGLMRDSYYRIACIDLYSNSMRTVVIADDEIGDMKRFQDNYKREIIDFAANYVMPEFKERFLNLMMPERIEELFDKGSKYADIVYKRREKDEICWVRTELIPMKGYGISNKRVMWYVKNISNEKALEKKLSQNLLMTNTDINLRLETILNGISGGFKISVKDEKYTFNHVSKDAAAIQGYSVKEFLEASNGNAVDNVYPPDLEKALEKN